MGVEDDGCLIVTNSYAIPVAADEAEISDFEEKMFKSLGELNYEQQHVGWYQFGRINAEAMKQLIHVQYLQQKEDKNMVGLLVEKRINRLDVFGFQLTEDFMKIYDQKSLNTNISLVNEIIHKIPVTVSNSYLLGAMALSLTDRVLNEMEFNPEPSKKIVCEQLDNLIESADLFGQESWKLQNWYRAQKGDTNGSAKSSISKPNLLETVILSKQIESYCSQIEELSATLEHVNA